jgi:hypothetical protein
VIYVNTATKERHRPLSQIGNEIVRNWSNPYYGAVPYINAMRQLDQIGDKFYADTAQDVVLRFLCNCGTWRGETARKVKAELKAIVKSTGYKL